MNLYREFKFARAIYCPGVDKWYLRFGSQQGVDVMFEARSEESARMHAKLINESLERDLKERRGWTKQ